MLMKYMYKAFIALLLCSLVIPETFAQTLTDGPIQLQVRLRAVRVGFTETDAGVLGVGFAPDEPTVKVWARDNPDLDAAGWTGGTCHAFNIPNLPQISPVVNEIIFNHTYTTPSVPQFFDLRVEAYEDDNPSDALLGFCSNGQVCTYNAPQCCGLPVFGICVGLNEGDDRFCNANPFRTSIPYRNGPPCQWFDQGEQAGTCGNDWRPIIETYWRYTKGTSCVDAIDLGTLNVGGTLTHFNSNQCYTNTHTVSPGKDVWYKFSVNGPIGVTASLCGVNGAQFDSYLYLYSACGQAVADTANDDGCGNQSVLAYSICQAGTYYLVVDGKSATDEGTFTLSVTENPNFVFGATVNAQDVSCFGGSDGQATVVVQGGTAPFTYAWSNGSTGTSISGLSGGAVTVTVTDFKGCVATASAQINVPTQLTATATGNAVTCGGICDGSASVSAQGGSFPYSYAWNSQPPQQLQNATFLCAGNYNVTVTDSKGCTVATGANVPNTTTTVITLDSLKNVQCFGLNNGGVFISATGGQLPYTYAWSNGPATEDNANLGPGIYSITITDNIGCTVGETYTITEPTLLTSNISFTFNPRCNAGSDGIVNVSVNGGVQPYAYQWSAPTNATTQNLNNVVAGSHTVTVSDANGCTVVSNAVLTEPAPFSVTISSTDLLCNGATNGTATVNVSGQTAPYTYFWSNFATTAATSGLDGGPFSVIIKDANGCDTILVGTINEPSEIDIQLTAVEPLCASAGNGAINSTVTGGTAPYTYAWNNGLAPVANPAAGSGSYTLTVTDANGCTSTESVGVNAPSPFTVNVIGINPSCQGDSSGVATANTTGGTSPFTYQWSNSPSNTLAYLERIPRGLYSVTVTDANGCTSSGQTFLDDPIVDPESCKPDKYVVLVPTAFSPNGDNVNDRLVAITKNVQKLEFRVYNRWGELVYENLNMLPGDGWDGFFRNKEQPIGTYIYTYNVTYINGVQATEKGSATLIR